MATLKRTSGSNLFEAFHAPGGSRFAYWSASNLAGDEISLAQAWAGEGVFAITAAGDSTADIERFCQVRWSEGKGKKVIAWRQGEESNPLRLFFDAKGNFIEGVDRDLIQIAVGATPGDQKRLILRRIAGAPFLVDVDAAGTALRFVAAKDPVFEVLLHGEAIDLVAEPAKSKVFAWIAVEDGGEGSGCWRFRCAKTSTAYFLETAVPMIRYVEGKSNVHRGSVFDIAKSRAALDAVDLTCRFHPFVVGPLHTEVRFAAAGTPLVSHFLDAAGRPVGLKSTPDSALQLLENPPGSGPRAHLAPSGVFKVSFAATTSLQVGKNSKRAMEVIAGGTGTEFILFGEEGSADFPDSLQFVPGSPAHVRYGSSGEPQWTSAATTSWVAPVHDRPHKKAASFQFTSQPQEAPLFGIKAKVGSRNARTGLREAPGMAFDTAPITVGDGSNAIAMPMIPLGGMSAASLASSLKLDRRGLVPHRRLLASNERRLVPARVVGSLASEPPLRWVVMPQGYSVALDDSNRWWKVSFAVAVGEISAQLVLNRPMKNGTTVDRWPVEESLSRSATFVVATRFPDRMPDSQGQSPESQVDALLSVGGWSVKLSVGPSPTPMAAAEPPILVVKLGGGRSFLDLAAAPADWSLAPVFNRDAAATQAALLKTVEKLEGLTKRIPPEAPAKKIPEDAAHAYKLLYDKLNDPEWNGVVLFNGISDVSDLPGGVAALKAGVDTQRKAFWAPCLGLDLCKVVEEAQVPATGGQPPAPTQVPSFFAGVHFFDPEELDTAEPGFKMKLKSLDMVLHNSALRLFLAKADLRVSDLFGAQAKDGDAGDRRNRIVAVEGSYQGRSAQGTEDQYLIRALGTQDIQIETDYLQRVRLTRLELSSRNDGAVTRGRFGLWGELAFGGGVTDLTGVKSVKFENLSISVAIEKDKDAKFNFDAGHIDVDWEKSTTASAGWLDKFPLKLGGMRWGGGDFSLPQGNWPNLPKLELPQLGYSDFGLSDLVPNLGNLGTSFDFGLEFDMDMGSFGGMTDAAKLFRCKVLLGWHDFRRVGLPRFAVGFKFEGGAGPLDIGIQGVIRLKAKKAILRRYKQASGPELLGIGLEEPQLEVLGYKIPEEPKKDLRLALVVELGDSERHNNLPTWVFASPDVAAGPVALKYFSIGQNVLLLPQGSAPAISNVTQAVTASRQWLEDKFGDEGLDQLRPDSPSGKWNLVADGAIVDDIAKVKLVFLDDVPLYGLRVEAPIAKPLFAVDILYKKISEDLGVFSVEIDLKGMRTFEIGVGSLTLPIFTFRKFTNSDWDVNFGFNYNDFSAAATLQAFPFLGSAALRFGQLSGQSGNFLLAGASAAARTYYRSELDLKPVYEIQMAFRVGIGKEIRQGIFSAGASLSIYGIFQGALGTINDARARGHRYVKLAGAAGILLEVFGEVNFSVISAAVCIRAWVETGLVLETWHEVAIYAEAGVSVYVRFVIASFRVFGRRVEIAVHYSFSTTLRIGATLPFVLDQPAVIPPPSTRSQPLLGHAVAACKPPLDWVAQRVVENTLLVPVAVSADPEIGDDGQPLVVPMLALVDGHPQGRAALGDDSAAMLVVIALRWAVRLAKGLTEDPATIDAEDLRTLMARLRGPGQKPASRWMTVDVSRATATTHPLSHEVIREFLRANVELQVDEPAGVKALLLSRLHTPTPPLAEQEPLPGIVMPWLRELGLRVIDGRTLRDFTDGTYEDVDEAWEARLRKALSQGRPRFDSLDPCASPALMSGALARPVAAQKKAMLDVLLEDWFACVVESAAYAAFRIVEKAPGAAMPYADLERALKAPQAEGAAPLAAQVAQQAGAILMHAMRAPSTSNVWVALAARSSLQIGFGADGFGPGDKGLAVVVPPGSWITGAAVIPFMTNAGDAKSHMEKLAASAMRLHPKLQVEELLHSNRRTATASRGAALYSQDGVQPYGTLFALPQEVASMQADAREPGEVPHKTVAIGFQGLGEFKPGESLAPASMQAADADAVRVGGLLKLSLRRVSTVAGNQSLRGIYAISGGGEIARLVLQSWQRALARIQPTAFLLVWNPSSGKVPDGSSGAVTRIIDKDVRFFVTNLSTEANPDARIFGEAAPSVVADVDDLAGVREFLWKTALVNSDGFFVGLGARNADAVDAIEAELDSGRAVEISLAWTRKAFASGQGELHPFETHMFVDPQPNAKDLTVRLGLGSAQAGSGVPDGMVKLVVRKNNEEMLAAATEEERELLSRYAFVEYAVAPVPDPASSPYVSMSADECTPLPLEAPPNDTARPLARQEPKQVEHHVLVPVLNFAKVNRDAHGDLLTDPDALNPYALIGTDLSKVLRFGLRDGAGHRYPRPIDVTIDDLQLVYREPLRPLSAYPGTSLSWFAAAGSGHAKLTMVLAWKMKDAQLAKESVVTARNLFQRLGWMLAAPGTRTQAFFSVGEQVVATLPEAQVRAALQGFVSNVLTQLKAHMQTPKPELAWQEKFEFKVPPAVLPPLLPVGSPPQLLESILALEREEGAYDKRLAATDAAVRRVECKAVALADGDTGKPWPQFAADFENAFSPGATKSVYFLKLPGDGGYQSCWLAAASTIRRCLQARKKLLSFAPRPLSTEFQSGEAQLLDVRGELPPVPLRKTVADIDLDLLASRSFEFIESVLKPEVAAKMCSLSRASFEGIMASKSAIAAAYADRLLPIEKSNEEEQADEAVKTRFLAASAANLTRIYELGAICAVQYEPAFVTGAPATNRVYGDLEVVNPKRPQTFDLSNLRLPLDGTSPAAFSVFWKGKRRAESVQGEALRLTPRYVECQWTADGFGKYIPSRWFELLSPAARAAERIELPAALVIPLPLRLLPVTPHLYGHSSMEWTDAPASLQEARRWVYTLDAAVPGEEQDRANFAVQYEAPPAALALATERGLFDALVTFDHYQATLADDLAAVLRWQPGADPVAATAACERMKRFIADVASELSKAPRVRADAHADGGPVDSFVGRLWQTEASKDLQVEGGSSRYRLDFGCLAAARTTSKRRADLELTDISRGAPMTVGAAQSQPIDDVAAGKTGYAVYSGQDAAVRGISGLSGRRLTLRELDIFQHATATSQVRATRNERLGDLPIAKAFVFTTGVAKTARLVPRLGYKQVPAPAIGGKPLSEHVAAVAQVLLADASHALTIDAEAVLRLPYPGSPTSGFTYPLSTMKGQRPENNDWVTLFREWGGRLEGAVVAKSDRAKPIGVELSLAVYAEGYAGSRPVLVIEKVLIPWAQIAPALPSFGRKPQPVHGVEHLAAVVFAVTEGLQGSGPGAVATVQQARDHIAWFVRAQVPSMNVLDEPRVPHPWELRDEKTALAWEGCIQAAVGAFSASPAGLPLAWSLEPADFEGNLRGLLLGENDAFLGDTRFGVRLDKIEGLRMQRLHRDDVFEGGVSLVSVVPLGAPDRKSAKKKGKV
jgi:hypothetical protein